MYQQFFGMTEAPFSIAPNPRYLFMSARHREAFAHLRYGLGGDGGVILLTGEVGTGKTTVCRCLLEKLPDNTKVAFILNPKVSVSELLETICDELEIEYDSSKNSIKHYVDQLNSYLLAANAANQHTVVIIDEAQNLSIEVLEQLRLLTNLETHQKKLLQIMLLGQPELQQLLDQPALRQFTQRVIARYHLQPLSYDDVKLYIRHRLAVSGCQRMLFSNQAVSVIFRLSNGIPRLINLICDRALLGCYSRNKHQVDKAMAYKAAQEVMGEHKVVIQTVPPSVYWGGALIAGAILVAMGYMVWQLWRSHLPSTVVAEAQPAAEVEPIEVKPEVAAIAVTSTPQAVAVATTDKAEDVTPEWQVQNTQQGYAALLSLWGFVTELPDDLWQRCNTVMVGPLRCEVLQGQVADLFAINRAVLLKLYLAEGVSYIPLVKAQQTQFTLQLPSGPKTVSLVELSALWKGEFSYFWRPPTGYTGLIRLGSQGDVVTWLELQLARIQQQRPRDAVVRFDNQLHEAVKVFQAEQGLTPDGVVGERTLLKLNQLLFSVPQLRHPALSQRAGES